MADLTLDELRARLHPTGDDGEWFARDELALMVEGIDAAIKQREQDAKDAARYRWLRLHYDVSASRHGVNDLLAIRLPQESLTHTGSIMDSFVDNAMLAAQENPNG